MSGFSAGNQQMHGQSSEVEMTIAHVSAVRKIFTLKLCFLINTDYGWPAPLSNGTALFCENLLPASRLRSSLIKVVIYCPGALGTPASPPACNNVIAALFAKRSPG